MPTTTTPVVRVEAPARLHLGFLDPSATLGRRFGGIGLALNGLSTVIEARAESTSVALGKEVERVTRLVEKFSTHFDAGVPARIETVRAIPDHAGLGSGTQLALAVGSALANLNGLDLQAATLASALGRGHRSGIGIGAFERGGLIVDGGLGPASQAPPVLSRLAFPGTWRAVLVMDQSSQGLSGGAEKQAFRHLRPLPAARAAHLCHLTMMRLLPAVAEADFPAFADSVGEIQAIVGEYFAAVQDGPYTSKAVHTAVDFVRERFQLSGTGQSSWGPTAFAFSPDEQSAREVVTALEERFPTDRLAFGIHGGRNHGADIGRVESLATMRRARG